MPAVDRPGGGIGKGLDRRWVVLVLVCTAQFLVVLDSTIVLIALPSIQRDLGFSDTNLQWVLNGYLLTFGGLLLLGGRASDLFVRRTVFLTGLVVFGAASLACGLSDGPAALVVARVAQGVGAAFMSATALAILTATFTGSERNRALGVWGGLSGVAGAMAAALTEGFQLAFYVGAGFASLGIVVALLVITGHKRGGEE